jgi:hypothetical protein
MRPGCEDGVNVTREGVALVRVTLRTRHEAGS